MTTDRTETSDLARAHPAIVDKLSTMYDQWAADSDVVPPEQLKIKEIPGSKNPLTRSPEEMQEYIRKINVIMKKRGFKTFQ